MKLKLVFILLIQAFILNAQISNKLKKKLESIDKKYFAIMLKERYDTEAYNELGKMYYEISTAATNDELFYLALNGNTFIRYHAVSTLVYKNDKRIIELYKYYSEFPLIYEIKMSCVIEKQDIAFNIRGKILYRLNSYEDYKYFVKRINNQPITDLYSKEEIDDFETLDPEILRNFMSEFEKIDEKFIPQRIEIGDMIKDAWRDGKLQTQ